MRLLVSSLAIALFAVTASAQVAPQGVQPQIQPSNTWAPAPAPSPAAAPAPSDPLVQSGGASTASSSSSPAVPRGIQPGKSLGLEQTAWQDPTKHMSKRQSRPGFIRYQWRPDDIMQINVREGLVSVVKFPSNEDIVQVISSDPATFEAMISPNKRSFLIRSVYAGVDGNVIAYGSSGNVYNFYIRSLVFNANLLPDATVEIAVGGMAATTGETVTSQVEAISGSTGSAAGYKGIFTPAADRAVAHYQAGGREYARGAPIDPANMRANITIKAPTSADAAIAPVRAWHDGKFTYLDFGPNASSMVQWPVAALVVQGVESPVGTRVTGKDRSMMVVEAVGNIVLRNGQYMVCLFAHFENNDARYSVNPTLEGANTQVNNGIPIRAPAAALSYEERAKIERDRLAAEEKTRLAQERRLLAEAVTRSKQAEVDAKKAEAAAKLVREQEAKEAQRRAAAADAERRRIEANTPPPAPGSLSATVGPIGVEDGRALLAALEAKHGRQVKGLSVNWQSDRGLPLSASTAKGRVYLVVDGLSGPLSIDLCSAARARSAGCSAVR